MWFRIDEYSQVRSYKQIFRDTLQMPSELLASLSIGRIGLPDFSGHIRWQNRSELCKS